MGKSKNIYLFGAGAVIPWGGPKTSELNDKILKTGFNCSDGKTKVTKWIYDKLLHNFESNDVNFETIINTLEALLSYYSSTNNTNRTSYLYPFLKPIFEEKEIFNFEADKESPLHGFKLKILDNEWLSDRSAINGESFEQFYLQLLLTEIISNISIEIANYSHHNEYSSKINCDENEIINKSFIKFIRNITSRGNSVRIYSLNYDRIFYHLLNENGIEIFDGVTYEEKPITGKIYEFDVKKILSDIESNVYYNIHGCVDWIARNRNVNLRKSISLSMIGYPYLQINNREQPSFELELGNVIHLSNIVTGYQKVQKTAITPLKQMQFSFDRDLVISENLIIVGYSFGDPHINEAIKTALMFNQNIKIEIVDPFFRKNQIDSKLSKILSNSKKRLTPKNINEYSCSFLNDQVLVIEKSFENYLYEKNVKKL